jgi:hypothetical protein
MSRRKLVPAAELQVGDVVEQEDFHARERFEVEIVAGPAREKGLASTQLLVYQGRIIVGPRRVGETGRVSYGVGGLARLVRRGVAS